MCLPSFPDLPAFTFHLHNTQEQKTSEKQERPGRIHHVHGYKVDIWGEGSTFKYIHTKLESEFLAIQDK